MNSSATNLDRDGSNRPPELRLKQSGSVFENFFERSVDAVWLLDPQEGVFVDCNQAAVELIGAENKQQLLRMRPAELSPPVQPDGSRSAEKSAEIIALIQQQKAHLFEWVIRRLDGRDIPIEVSATVLVLGGKNIQVIISRDISERKKAERELLELTQALERRVAERTAALTASEARLRESEARFSAAFHASPVNTAIARAGDGRFVLANDAFLNWAGYERDEVLGRTAIELGIWENAEERNLFWDEVRSAGSVRARECRLRNRHGRHSTMLASGAVIALNGEDHFLGILLDITQRKQVERELHRTVAREKELSQLKSNFVSMVSHEFRTPLGIIQSSAELLRDFHKKMSAAEREDQQVSIIRNARRMAGMMEEVLVLSCLDAGKLNFQPAPLNLNVFCRRVVDEVVSTTGRRCLVELSLNCISPEAHADERLIGHIFTNLLSNAVKYSEPGASVQFIVEQQGNDAVCVIRDKGIGISEEDQQQLFEAFHRGSNVGTRPGTGLGLLLVKRCAELHGGKVQLNSKIGEGTTVTVRFPAFLTGP